MFFFFFFAGFSFRHQLIDFEKNLNPHSIQSHSSIQVKRWMERNVRFYDFWKLKCMSAFSSYNSYYNCYLYQRKKIEVVRRNAIWQNNLCAIIRLWIFPCFSIFYLHKLTLCVPPCHVLCTFICWIDKRFYSRLFCLQSYNKICFMFEMTLKSPDVHRMGKYNTITFDIKKIKMTKSKF